MTTTAPLDPRTRKAATIVANGDVVEVKPGLFHVTDRTGSGREHVTTQHTCTCEDKARHPDKRCKHQRSVEMKQAQTACPTCGAVTYADMFYVSGTYRTFRICTVDKYHKAMRLS